MASVTSAQTPTDFGLDTSPYNASMAPETGTSDYFTDMIRVIFLILETALLLTLNPLCLLALSHVRNTVQDTSKVFLRSMTAADLGMGIFGSIPMTLTAIYSTWPLGQALCMMVSLLVPCCLLGSLTSLLLLTVDRYISVVHALRYLSLVTVRRAQIAACTAWAVVLCIVTGIAFLNDWQVIYNDRALRCVFHDGAGSYIFVQVICTLIMLSCMLTLVAVYTRLFLISYRHARRINVDNQPAGRGNQLARPGTKTLHTLLLIALTTLLFHLLPIILFTLQLFDNAMLTFFLAVLPTLTSGWVNVVIYYLKNREIRRATIKLLGSCYNFCKRGTQ